MNEASADDLIERVYDMALEPDLWPDLVERLAGALGAHAGTLEQEDMESSRGGGLCVGVDPVELDRYFDYYASRNVLRRFDNVRERMKSFKPAVTADQQFLSKSQLMETEFYVDFFKPAGLHSVMTIGLWHQGVRFTGLDLYRGPTQPQFSADDIVFAEAIHPHLIRAFHLSRKFQEMRRVNIGLAAAVDRSPFGVLVLDRSARVLHANAQAERALAEPGGLTVQAGRLTACNPADAGRLSALIDAASRQAGRVGGAVSIARPTDRPPLTVTAAPVGPERLSLFSDAPGVLLAVTDPEASSGMSEECLREAYGLTPAQARVTLSLVDGRSPRQTAEALGVSIFTVRAHLAQIYEKTGARRQAELVALVTRGQAVGLT